LSKIEYYLDQTFSKNNSNFIEIEDIATVEYKIENNQNEIIVKNIYFNESSNNTNNQNQRPNSNNRNRKQLVNANWDIISKDEFGFTLVKSNNGEYYNYLDKNGKIISPNQWFTKAGDFIERDGIIYSNVEVDNRRKVFLATPTYKLVDVNESVEKTIKKVLAEQSLQKSLDFMQRLLSVKI